MRRKRREVDDDASPAFDWPGAFRMTVEILLFSLEQGVKLIATAIGLIARIVARALLGVMKFLLGAAG